MKAFHAIVFIRLSLSNVLIAAQSQPQKYIDMYGDCDKAYCKYAENLDTVGSDFIWLANNKFSIPEMQEKYDMLFTVCFDWLKDNLSNIW